MTEPNMASPTSQPPDSAQKPSRVRRWEDDFSRNALDDEPFHNHPPVAQYRLGSFQNWRRLIPAGLISGESKLAAMIARDQYPIPSGPDRENYMPESDAGYWMSGLGDCLKVIEAAQVHSIDVESILDFGCASGRVARHFCIQCGIEEVWGTEINARHIRWLSAFMPGNLKPVFSPCLPSLPLADESVDVVSAFSVFTHIDTFETGWLAELRRILRPGGLCYLTVHNEETWSALRELDSSNRLLKSMLDTGKFSMEMLDGPLPGERLVYRFSESGPYRSQVFHSNAWLERTWGRFFEMRRIVPGGHGRQSVVLMTRPAAKRPSIRKAA